MYKVSKVPKTSWGGYLKQGRSKNMFIKKGEVLRLWSSLGDVLKYAIGFTVLILLSGNVIALVMKKATIVLYIVIGPAGQQTYRALVITCPTAATTTATATATILPNPCQ